MNRALYFDWAHKRMAVMNYRMEKIGNRRKKRTSLMLKVVIPTSVSFIAVGAFTVAQSFTLAYLICCFIIAVGISTLMYFDDADNKKFVKILESWSDMTDERFLPPSIIDT